MAAFPNPVLSCPLIVIVFIVFVFVPTPGSDEHSPLREGFYCLEKKLLLIMNLQIQIDVQPKSLRRNGDRGLLIPSLRMNKKACDTLIFKCIADSNCK